MLAPHVTNYSFGFEQREVEAMKMQNELVRAQLQDQVTRVS